MKRRRRKLSRQELLQRLREAREEERRQKWQRRFRFARDSLEANLNQFFDHLDTLVAFRLLHFCYGILMLILFYVLAFSLLNHLEARRERVQELQQEVLEPQQP